MALIDDIRAKYPDPVVFGPGCHKGKYCVGGALLYYSGIESRDSTPGFPIASDLAPVLSSLNPHLREAQAMLFAIGIVGKNDYGKFDEAWTDARQALEYKAEAVPESLD